MAATGDHCEQSARIGKAFTPKRSASSATRFDFAEIAEPIDDDIGSGFRESQSHSSSDILPGGGDQCGPAFQSLDFHPDAPSGHAMLLGAFNVACHPIPWLSGELFPAGLPWFA